MSVPEIHKENVGTIFRFEILDQDDAPVDVSIFTLLQIRFRKPDRTTLLIKADPDVVFTTDGTDGKIEYPTEANDLDVAGVWFRQAHVIIPSGDFWTETKSFEVKDNL